MTARWLGTLTRLLTCGLLVPGLAAGRFAADLSQDVDRSADPLSGLALPVVAAVMVFAVVTVAVAVAGAVLPWPRAASACSMLSALWVLCGTLAAVVLRGWSWSPWFVLGVVVPSAVLLCSGAGTDRLPPHVGST